MVRQVIVCLAYYRGLRHTEMMGLQVEMCVSAPEGVLVTLIRSKQRSDKRNSKFLVPRKKENSCADVLDLYLITIKDKLGQYTGRLLWSGSASAFINIPMGRNMVSKVPSDMAKRLQ